MLTSIILKAENYLSVVKNLVHVSYPAPIKAQWGVTALSLSSMAQSRYVFHVLGDSNVHKFLPIVKAAKSDPAVKNATYTRVTNSVALMDALTKPEVCHRTIIISALTNIITSNQFISYDTMSAHASKAFDDVLSWIAEGREYLDGFAARVSRLKQFRCFLHTR